MRTSRIMFFIALAVVVSWGIKMFIIEEQNPVKNPNAEHIAWAIMIVVSILIFIPSLVVGFLGK
jgi:ABC-type transport system involved in cytochrome c biogenesis permease subunit